MKALALATAVLGLACSACGGGASDPEAAKRNVEAFAQKTYPGLPTPDEIQKLIGHGQHAFKASSCEMCHSTTTDRKGLAGPALGGVSARVLERHKGDPLEARRWLAKHVRDPQVFPGPNAGADEYRGLAMPPNAMLREEQMRALVEYLWSLP